MIHSSVQDENLKKTPKGITINGETYDEIPKAALLASKWLTDAWEYLGKPETPFTESGKKLMNLITAIWEDLYPQDAKEWYEARAEHQKNELSISEQVHRHTGRSLASYPMPIFRMMKKIFPTFKLGERKNTMSVVKEWGMFRMANKV